MWQPISSAPLDRDLELAVIDNGEVHVVAFACRQFPGGGWIKAGTEKQIDIHPTHWRDWTA